MKKYIISFSVLLFSICYSQDKISGYVIFDYENIHGSDNFDINRAYFQYAEDISDELFFKIRFDVGRDADEEDSKLSTYIKNAYIDWNCSWGGKLSMGLIGTNTYGVQENTWGYRFIEKSVLDKYGMTNTADFGIGYSVNFGNLNVNIQSLNGEGYKNTDADGNQSLYMRLLYGESSLNKNTGYNLGAVMSTSLGDETEDMVGFFGGLSSDEYRIGFEHNSNSQTFTEEATSLYVSYSLNSNLDMFYRYDINNENADNEETDSDGDGITDFSNEDVCTSLIGIVWNPTKGLYIAPNVIIGENDNTYRVTCMFKY